MFFDYMRCLPGNFAMTVVVSPSVQLGSIFGALINIVFEFLLNERIIQHAGVNFIIARRQEVQRKRFRILQRKL